MKESTYFIPLKPEEKVWGWGYYLIQLLLLPTLFTSLNGLLTEPLSEETLNFCYFSLNFLMVLIIFRRFLGISLLHGICHPFSLMFAVGLGLAGFLAVEYGINWGIDYFFPGFQNPNDASLTLLTQNNWELMAFGTIVMVPVAEEVFYRGLMFRGLFYHSSYAAIICSVTVFSLIHVAPYFGTASLPVLGLAFCQYIPAGLILAWSYHKSNTILAPILIHALVNAQAILQIKLPWELF